MATTTLLPASPSAPTARPVDPADGLRRRRAAAVPRYTSYPTAPHFDASVDAETYRGWLGALPPRAVLSLYVHVPFCDTLCWFCGCHTKITRSHAPVARYRAALEAELLAVGRLVPAGARVQHMHWGGGSPTLLDADDMARLVEAAHRAIPFAPGAEFAVEVDPRGLTLDRVAVLAASGLTRVSIGVQDLDPEVQRMINRVQSLEETRRAVDAFRERGVRGLNIDAMYGLPGQGDAQLMATLEAVAAMAPDRIALFGYAHVPWLKRHMRLIPEERLPGPDARHAQAERAAAFLVAQGYERIGIDHFARPHDSLAVAAREGRLQRNFQGYTVDPATALLGFGASAIGRLPEGYVQNETPIAAYERAIAQDGLAVARGRQLTREDRIRAHVIERLMCQLTFDHRDLTARYGAAAGAVILDAARIVKAAEPGLLRETAHGFTVTEAGRPFLRTFAAGFDAYLGNGLARHSPAV